MNYDIRKYIDQARWQTSDIVIFSVVGKALKVLMVQRGNWPFQDCWALPGGFIEQGESSFQAAQRELREETGVDTSSLEQIYTFDEPDRDPRGPIVSTAYLAVVSATEIKAGSDATQAQWFEISHLIPSANWVDARKKYPVLNFELTTGDTSVKAEELAFDHRNILSVALPRIQDYIPKFLWDSLW